MKKLFIMDLKKGDKIFDESFAVKKYKKAVTRSNKPYIDLLLADNSGIVGGKIWEDNFRYAKDAKEGDVVTIDAVVQDFQGELQLVINKMDILKDFNGEDYLQKSDRNVEDMYSEIEKTIKNIKDAHLKKLLNNIFDNKKFQEEYKKAAAAYLVHHAYSGGLVEHTVEMLHIAKPLIESFPKVNADLIYAGIILHDIGKMQEYEITSTVNITTEGKILGHIFLGANFVKEKANEVEGLSKDLLDELLHIILSHQGNLEFGSPVKPKTVEAMIVWQSDYASSQVNIAYKAIQEGTITDNFTSFQKQLGTELYKPSYNNTVREEESL